MPTFVTRITVTQTDDYQPPPHDITAVPGFTVWLVEWVKVENGREGVFRTVLYSKADARKLTMNLLTMRRPGTEVGDVLTLVGFDL
ncbi:MAG: hypothetical protein WBB07_17705 [Mycobacterium sp.]